MAGTWRYKGLWPIRRMASLGWSATSPRWNSLLKNRSGQNGALAAAKMLIDMGVTTDPARPPCQLRRRLTLPPKGGSECGRQGNHCRAASTNGRRDVDLSRPIHCYLQPKSAGNRHCSEPEPPLSLVKILSFLNAFGISNIHESEFKVRSCG